MSCVDEPQCGEVGAFFSSLSSSLLSPEAAVPRMFLMRPSARNWSSMGSVLELPGDLAPGCAGDANGVPLCCDISTVRPRDPLEETMSSELVSRAGAAEAEPLSAELAAPFIASVRLPRRASAGAAERQRRPAGVGWVSPPLLPKSSLMFEDPPLVKDVVSGVAELEGVDEAIASKGRQGNAGRPTVPGALVRLITCVSWAMCEPSSPGTGRLLPDEGVSWPPFWGY